MMEPPPDESKATGKTRRGRTLPVWYGLGGLVLIKLALSSYAEGNLVFAIPFFLAAAVCFYLAFRHGVGRAR